MNKRKKIFGGLFAILMVAAIALNVNVAKSNNSLSDVFLANVEALANTDIDPIDVPCEVNPPYKCAFPCNANGDVGTCELSGLKNI